MTYDNMIILTKWSTGGAMMKNTILNAALTEFGQNPYDKVSMNSIRKQGDISKGILYHYFKNKDDLYLQCISISLKELLEHLQDQKYTHQNLEEDLRTYYQERRLFFNEHKQLETIFVHAKFNPPNHLLKEINAIFKDLDTFNQSFFVTHLKGYDLREDFSIEDVMRYFTMMSDGIVYHMNLENQSLDESVLMKQEQGISEMVSVILFGVLKGDRK